MTRLIALDDHMRATLLHNIDSLIFGIVEGFLGCVALWDGNNDGRVYPESPTHTSELVKLKGRDIALLVEQLKERLDAEWMPADIDKIGAQFRALFAAYPTNKSLQSVIDACDHKCSFDFAWAEQGPSGRFDTLACFVG